MCDKVMPLPIIPSEAIEWLTLSFALSSTALKIFRSHPARQQVRATGRYFEPPITNCPSVSIAEPSVIIVVDQLRSGKLNVHLL